MKHVNPWIFIALTVPSLACQCERVINEDTDADATFTSGTFEALTTTSTTMSDADTGPPFDASRWIGRYHYKDAALDFGERGRPLGSFMLANFEIFPDSTASMSYDECAFDVPITIAYEWTPDEPGWLELHAGAGEPSLRILAGHDLESLRIHLVEPCRELEFEIDGHIDQWIPFYPGESCWVDRCLWGSMMQVDYCPGEEPPPCP